MCEHVTYDSPRYARVLRLLLYDLDIKYITPLTYSIIILEYIICRFVLLILLSSVLFVSFPSSPCVHQYLVTFLAPILSDKQNDDCDSSGT